MRDLVPTMRQRPKRSLGRSGCPAPRAPAPLVRRVRQSSRRSGAGSVRGGPGSAVPRWNFVQATMVVPLRPRSMRGRSRTSVVSGLRPRSSTSNRDCDVCETIGTCRNFAMHCSETDDRNDRRQVPTRSVIRGAGVRFEFQLIMGLTPPFHPHRGVYTS
jgi:hypothetical protein